MKKIILFVTMAIALSAFSGTALARRYDKNTQYSNQEDVFQNPLDAIFGGPNWSVSPQVHYYPRKHANSFYHTYTRNFAGKASPSIVAYGHMLQQQGIRVSEHPAFGGVHHVHHGHGHYAGRAIDINVGRGMREASNAHARHWFDGVAARARAAGYMVLWKVAGHFDHMHIEKR
jgi:hypothetical protein